MTTVVEMPIRLGGDPRDLPESAALSAELAKLTHPACPDVGWAQVERWCLALFRQNGAELQTAACYVLACGHREGLSGLARSMTLVESLMGHGTNVWPPHHQTRLGILDGLFEQLLPLIRRLEIEAITEPMALQALADLHTRLERLDRQVLLQTGYSPVALDTLRQRVARIRARIEPEQPLMLSHTLMASESPSARTRPESICVVPVVKGRHFRYARWGGLAALMLSMAMGALAAWQGFQNSQTMPALPEAVQLSSLSLFNAGSAALRPESTKALVEALVSIKARPGWLIVIAGHTDSTGDAADNLQLSRDRALAVKAWLQRMGDVPDRCFAVQGLGGEEPMASDRDELGRAANRRVSIRLIPQTEACAANVDEARG